MDRIELLGCPIYVMDYCAVLDWMADRITTGSPSVISVVNANKLWMMSKNPRLENIVKNSDLILGEWAVLWAAKILGIPLKTCVYGIELSKMVIPWAQKNGYRLYFLGAKPDIVSRLVLKLSKDFPGLQIAGYHHGYLDQDTTRDVIQQIKTLKPDVIFVAMGSPRQEYWINESLNEIGVPISIGVGGTFDVLAGIKHDTPSWARGHGLEWLYRLSQDPKAYWRRYLITNSWLIWNVFIAYLNQIGKRKTNQRLNVTAQAGKNEPEE